MSYTYNLDGSVAAVKYPSGATITYTPDSAGRVISAVDKDNSVNYVTGGKYNSTNALTDSIYGYSSGSFSGIINSFSYNNRLQPVTLWSSSPVRTLMYLIYDFHLGGGDNGNVWGITNNRDTTRSQSFTYDALNRLASAQNAGTDCSVKLPGGATKFWGNSYGYDAWGNLLQKTPTKCSAENLSVTAGVNNQLQGGYSYDAAGNMTHDATASLDYGYDPENRIMGAAGFTYTYDADGNRVEKANGAIGTLYWYMTPGIVAESDLAGNLKSEYVFFNGERVARKDFPSNAVSYYFSDPLKTASVITDAVGNIKSESDYYPFGAELQILNSDSNKYKYGGHELDGETGNYDYGARYYSPAFSRFLTPDWAAKPITVPYANFGNPQSLNLYTYGKNNPTTFGDPDGHCPECAALGGADVSVSGAFFTAGAPLLPGMIGGGVGYYAIDTASSNNFVTADATMMSVHATNQLALALAKTPAIPKGNPAPGTQASGGVGPKGSPAPGTQAPATPNQATPAIPGTKPTSLPVEAIPGSTATKTHPDGSPKQIGEYGPDGKAKTDTDFHPSPAGNPHAHDWKPSPDGGVLTRGNPRPLQPTDPKPE